MEKTLFKGLTAAVLSFFMLFCVSCAKPTHQVYFKMTGVSTSTYITYDIYTSGTNAFMETPADSATVTATSLPWISDTITVKQGEIASMYVDIYDYTTVSPSVTMEIYSDGSKVKSTTCTGSNGSATMQMTF